jgi:hypothetical protein
MMCCLGSSGPSSPPQKPIATCDEPGCGSASVVQCDHPVKRLGEDDPMCDRHLCAVHRQDFGGKTRCPRHHRAVSRR